jgi:hypothetical protein
MSARRLREIPVVASRCTICLLGPVGSGKSSLLLSFVDCIEQLAHGYPLGRRIAVHDVEKDVFDSGVDATTGFLGNGNEQFRQLRKQIFSKTIATEAVAPGESAIREGDDTAAERDEKEVAKLRAALGDADAIVFAIPLTTLEVAGWLSDLRRVIAEMARSSGTKPIRVVIAFTHYERLFVQLGQDAFTYACQPEVALRVIRREIIGSTWAEGLKKLTERGTSVHFTVTSAYGFVKGFGNPNIDPHKANEEAPFGRDGTAAGLTRFWRPFLTAEPFICAALGTPSDYTFTFEQIEGWRPPPPPGGSEDDVELGMKERVSQRLRDWMQTLNKNRDLN